MTATTGAGDGAFVRPFVVTGGRTRPSTDLTFDSLVEAVDGASTHGLDPQLTSVLAACRGRTSVTDLALELRLPLGVASILVGDLIASGQLAPAGTTEWKSDASLLQRVLAGVQNL